MAHWDRKITGVAELFDEFTDGKLTLPEVTEKFTAILKADKEYPFNRELKQIVEELEIFQGEDDEHYFDQLMHAVYDWADRMRVWIEPLPARS
jgi:hypothetical protein